MNRLKKSLLVTSALATVSAGSIMALGVASAASSSGQQGLVEKIAAKFNLNKDEVQAVFDANHAEREAEHLQNLKERLDADVKAGTITQDQEDKILAKVKEMQTNREANRAKFEAMSQTERKEAMDKNRSDIQQWMTDNNIPSDYEHVLLGGGPHREGHGPHAQKD